ncbi:hypothetical protein IMAU10058_03009 [Lactiplantibacillus plantarum]|nr:hypothetical protein [Lactiplantibacillus plantarum]
MRFIDMSAGTDGIRLETEKVNEEINWCIKSMKDVGYNPDLDSLLLCNVGYSDWTYLDELAHRIYDKNQYDHLTDYQLMMVINSFLEVAESC